MTQHLIPHPTSPFDSIKQVEQGREYWSARDLQTLMDYNHWREFEGVIERTMIACQNVGQNAADHFGEAPKMVRLGSGSQRNIKDYHLSRYACYLVAMNDNPHTKAVAQPQAYLNL